MTTLDGDGDLAAQIRAYSSTDPATGCEIWNGSRDHTGYGVASIRRASGRENCKRVHRIAWEVMVGPIPTGLELDHLCHTNSDCDLGGLCPHRPCWNPDHLEPVTRRENCRRSKSIPGLNAQKTHCKRGHPLSGDNLFVDRAGGRICRQCRKEWDARRPKPQRAGAILSPKTFSIEDALAAFSGPPSSPAARLEAIHGPRAVDDSRCRTCRDSGSRPVAWPCITYVEMSALLGVPLNLAEVLESHNAGRAKNGSPPLKPTWVQSQALAETA